MSVDKKQLQHAGIEQEFHMIIFNFSGESVYDGMVQGVPEKTLL